MIVLFIVLILLLILLIVQNKLNNNTSKNHSNDDINTIIQTLVRQCARWAVAAQQDKSPIIALLHANYATGYLWALKDIATDNQIKIATNVDILEFTKKITNIQDISTQKVSHNCPHFLEFINIELAKMGGDN
jgi:hypothetical protein